MTTDLGLQLYTVRNDCNRDLQGTLRQVAAMGYRFVELYDHYGLSVSTFRSLLEEADLTVLASHVPLEKLERDLPATLEYYLSLGCQFLVCPYIAAERRRNAADYRELGQILTTIGKTCAAAGIHFCYHNHDFEFQRHDGQTGWEILMESSDPRYVRAELDLYWVKHSGGEPEEFLRQLNGRSPIVHLKDIGLDRETVAFGTGLLDWAPILQIAREQGVKYFLIEQDTTPGPALESVRISMNNFRYLTG